MSPALTATAQVGARLANCVGISGSAFTAGIVSKLIQYIRFITLNYPPRLVQIFQKQEGGIFNPPTQSSSKARRLTSHDPDSIFVQYGVDPTFLINFWDPIMMMSIASALWLICRGLLYCLKSRTYRHVALARKVITFLTTAALNFLIVQLYGSAGDVIFFTVIEMKSLWLETAWSTTSLVLCIVVLVLTICLLGLDCRYMLMHRKLRSRLSEEPTAGNTAESAAKKNAALETLHEEFRDTTLITHGFLLVLVIRDILISLVITLVLSAPVLQSVFLCCSSAMMCTYLFFNNPFRQKFDWAALLIAELCVLIVYICVVCLASLHPTETTIQQLSSTLR